MASCNKKCSWFDSQYCCLIFWSNLSVWKYFLLPCFQRGFVLIFEQSLEMNQVMNNLWRILTMSEQRIFLLLLYVALFWFLTELEPDSEQSPEFLNIVRIYYSISIAAFCHAEVLIWFLTELGCEPGSEQSPESWWWGWGGGWWQSGFVHAWRPDFAPGRWDALGAPQRHHWRRHHVQWGRVWVLHTQK